MHKGRAVCSAVDETPFVRPAAAMVALIDRAPMARAFPIASATRDHATSAIDKIPKRKIDRPAQMRGTLFLAA